MVGELTEGTHKHIIWNLVDSASQFKYLIHPNCERPEGKVLVTVCGVFAVLSKGVYKFCFLSSSGNTPLHLAVMMGHKGEQC